MRILFIGNSFTYFNDMPEAIFSIIAGHVGIDAQIESITDGGYTLERFADAEDAFGARVDKALSESKYDIVILQEQSHTPISNPDRFYSAVKSLQNKIMTGGARVYLYATWGYKEGSEMLSSFGVDTFDMEMKLRASYLAIGEALEIPVCPVGAAMSHLHASSDLELYCEDNFHPSRLGSSLAAFTIFGKIFGVEPSSLTGVKLEGVEPQQIKLLCDAASFACKNGASVPKKYAALYSEYTDRAKAKTQSGK